jgi:hypothetical protein
MPAISPVGRVSFPAVFKASKYDEKSKETFNITLLFENDMPPDQQKLYDAMVAAAEAGAQEKFGCGLGEKSKKYKNLEVKTPFRDGAEKPDLDGYGEGRSFVKFTNWTTRPSVGKKVNGKFTPIDEADGEFYGGCFAVVSYGVYAYETKGNIGVSMTLNNVCKVADGDSFSGTRTQPEDDFEALADVSDADPWD